MVSDLKCGRLYVPLVFLIMMFFMSSFTSAELNLKADSNSNKPLTPITVQLKWLHQFQFAGYYAAVAKGYYQQAGFDVSLKEAGPQINPVDEVLSGRANFGIANSELMLYHLNGEPVIALAAIIQHSPIVLMSLKSANILSPQDLIGKKLMYPAGHYGANTLGILLKEGIQKSQVESIPLSYNIYDLIEGKVDAMVGYVTDQPYLLKEKGIDYNLIDPRTYGIDFYGDVLFTSEQLAEDKPDQVVKFRAATLKGWRYAIEHPDEMVELILSQYPVVKTKSELQYEAQETIKLIVPKLVDLGHMNPGRWQAIAETFIELNMTDGIYEDDGFIYTPEKEQAYQILKLFIQIAGVLVMLIAICIAILFYFNKQLKLAIAEKTVYLTKANRELIVYTKQLKEKEGELFSLNKNLEKHVISRTETINKVNHELTIEIEQRKLRELSLQLLSKAIESSSSVVLIIDKQHVIRYASTAFLTLTGLTDQEIQDQPIKALENRLTLPEISNADFSPNSKGVVESELECIGVDGVTRWLNTAISLLWSDNQEISHYVIVFDDITALKNRKDEMEKIALYDPLTGLENRVLFKTRLEKIIQNLQRNEVKTALLFIDIDDFKSINDSLGHETGDHVLKTVAERLKTHTRKNDTVSRVSGDEFIILLNDIHAYDDASKVTRHIIESFKKPIMMNEREIFVTVSIGISVTPDDSVSETELINNADLAMYRAKQNGGNSYHFFCEDMNAEIRQKNIIELELKEAIRDENFFLTYLPVINLENSNIVGAEALIRWQFSEENVRNPHDFIPIAEESGSIIPMGLWVMKQAFADIQKLLASQVKHIKISVNIACRQLKDKHFISDVRKLFSPHPNYIKYFEFEITENCFIENQTENINALNDLRKMGFAIALDDFGTGYASLSYLQRIPVDTIKIDRSFLNELSGDNGNSELIQATVAMAHQLNLKVVAEGVENETQVEFLTSIGCDMGQGFYYDSPMLIDQLIARFSGEKSTYSTLVSGAVLPG